VPADAGGRFAVDLNSGQLTVADGTLLDHETNAIHNITVRTTDSGGLTCDEAFVITINDVNEAPVAANDFITATMTQTLNDPSIPVLANDNDVDGDTLAAVLLAGPASGTLTLNAD